VAHALEASGDEGILGDAAVVQEIGGRPCCVATGLLTAASRGRDPPAEERGFDLPFDER